MWRVVAEWLALPSDSKWIEHSQSRQAHRSHAVSPGQAAYVLHNAQSEIWHRMWQPITLLRCVNGWFIYWTINSTKPIILVNKAFDLFSACTWHGRDNGNFSIETSLPGIHGHWTEADNYLITWIIAEFLSHQCHKISWTRKHSAGNPHQSSANRMCAELGQPGRWNTVTMIDSNCWVATMKCTKCTHKQKCNIKCRTLTPKTTDNKGVVFSSQTTQF